MSIVKAILITILLLVITFVMGFGIHFLFEPNLDVSENINFYNHFYGISNIIYTVLSYIIILLIFKVNLNWSKRNEKMVSIKPRILFYLLIITLGLNFVERPLFDFTKIIDFIKDIGVEPYENLKTSTTLSLVYKGISILVIAPIFEEFLFRKYLFTELLKKYSLNISIFVSSICFAVIHLPGYRNLAPTFIFGIISSIVYVKTKNIIYPITLHFLTNLVWFLSIDYGEWFYKWIYGLEFNLIYWTLFGMGILLTTLGLTKLTTVNQS